MAERRKYLDNWPLNLDAVSVGRRHAEALWQAAHVVDFLASAFLASENLFCRQMSGEEDSVGASGVFQQRISHTGPDTAGGGTTGGITAMEEKKKKKNKTPSAPRSQNAGVVEERWRWEEFSGISTFYP